MAKTAELMGMEKLCWEIVRIEHSLQACEIFKASILQMVQQSPQECPEVSAAIKVVGYVRVSTYGQAKEGYSLAYQVEEIKRYCQQNGLELLRIYEDKGLSGAFKVIRQKGSHVQLEEPNGQKVTVPVHGNKDLPKVTLESIKKQADYKKR